MTLPTTYADGNTVYAADLNAWDTAINALTNTLTPGFTSTVTSSSPVTLVNTSSSVQVFTGSTAQTVLLPTTGVVAGCIGLIFNSSSAAITVQSSGANTINIVAAGTAAMFTALVAAPTTAANWKCTYWGAIVASGKSLTVSNSLTLVGTDGNTLTLPSGGGTVVIAGGALGTPSSGSLASCTGLPVAGIAASTSTALGVGSIELGHATDTTIARSGAGAITVEGATVLLSGGALGTPSGGTLTSCTGLPVAGIAASTSTALGVGSIELGHATDTTIARGGAGSITVEGVAVPTISSSDALSNKTLTNPTVTNYVETVAAIGTVTSASTLSLTSGTVQTATLTASTACTFTMPTATAGKSFVLLLKQAAATGNGTATFTGVKWNAVGTPVITATAGKMDIFTFIADGSSWYGSVSQGYTP